MLVSVDLEREFKSILTDFTEEPHPVAAVKECLVEELTFTVLRKKTGASRNRAEIKPSIDFLQRNRQLK
jgi:hypothetical protein